MKKLLPAIAAVCNILLLLCCCDASNAPLYTTEKTSVYCIYDAVDNEVVTLTLPDGWSFSSARLQESPDGRKFFVYNRDENDIFQLLVFDADTNTLIEMQRTNLNGLKDDISLLWSEENEIVIGQEGRQDFCIYDFSRE